MRRLRRSSSLWLVSQALCFCLLLQGTGIAQALPLPPAPVLVSQAELEAALARSPDSRPPSPDEHGMPQRFADQAWRSIEEARGALKRWLEAPWPGSEVDRETPLRVAQAGGMLPLPPRLMSVFLAASSRGQGGPPSPPGLAASEVEDTPQAELAGLLEKSATEQIPLLAGLNLISIPEEPADSDPAAVFAAVAGEVAKVTAYDACDLTDPWKVYDPADPAASDLTAVDHRIGMWVLASATATLPSEGTLPATTTIELCEGWNLIGLPTAEPRHPYTALASIAGKWERIFAYDAFDPEDPWEYFDPAVPDWANDLTLMYPGRGYWVLATEAVTLEIRNSGPPPIVVITAPADLAVITEPTEITGTVESDRLDSWTLTSRPIGDDDAVTLATGNAPITGGVLATFDPTLLLNGLYELELTATDVQGHQVTESIAVAVEGQMKIGHFTLSYVDLAVPVSGLDIEIIRTYDSRDQQPRDFGVGWILDIRQGSYRNNRRPGDGWQFQTGLVACDTALESKSHLTVVRLSDREVYRFALRLYGGAPSDGGGCFANARFDFIDGPLPGTTLEIIGNDQVFYENGFDQVINVDTFEPYEPEDVRLTTRDGRVFELDLNVGVTLVEDLNGNQLSITPAGLTHSSGRGIAFDRDAENRITRITDPLGRSMSYDYDAGGDLVRFTDRVGAVTRFTYDGDHRLLDIENADGVKPIRNEYDSEGRLVRHIDAFGKVIELGHDLGNRREVVTNRLGHSRMFEYDRRGNVVRETDELGNTTSHAYDGRDNLLAKTDPLGQVTTFTYTASNDLETLTDALGHTTHETYNGRGQVLTVTDPRGGVTSYVYDSSGNQARTTDVLGQATNFTYDMAGNLVTTTDVLGHVTSFEYDTFGNRLRETDALGHETISTYDGVGNRLSETRTRTLPNGMTETLVTSFTYDDLNRLTTTTAADGSTTSTSYDLLGKVTSRADALGRVTAMTYDLQGRRVTTVHPDGTATYQQYDDESRLVARIDRAGRTTGFSYDPIGQLLTLTLVDGSTVASTYDDAGQLVTTTDARGNATTFTYDADGNRTAIIDALGHRTTYAFDENGNQTSITDAIQHTTAFTYDAHRRLTTTTFPDGTSAEIQYDSLGRRVGEYDQAGRTTAFGYDELGRLTSVSDALGGTTRHSYDEVGNRLTQVDANNHTTRFEYDRQGRQIARVLPDGSRETMEYNSDGTLASHTDFKGDRRSFDYDVNQRLVRRAYPDGSKVTFSYTAMGKRAAETDSRGTTSYIYDSRDRLTEKTDPFGNKLEYTYDPWDSRTALTVTVGSESLTTAYDYDALNRLVTVTDSRGGVTNLAYDSVGNRSRLVFPNAITTLYTYDELNRLTELQSETSIGDILQRYQLTVGPAGTRTRIEEYDGTARHYQYDGLDRLAQERFVNLADELVYQKDFAYDPVGNRLTQTLAEGAEPTTVASTYDTRDRLLSAGPTTYSWGQDGSLSDRNDGVSVKYEWDFDNRLVAVTLDDGTLVEITYDADGNRVRRALTPVGAPATHVDYIVDTTGPLSHVVADVVGGNIETLYERAGDQVVAMYRPATGESRYFHVDSIGSVRMLSDEAAGVTDSYSYSAFGASLEHTGQTAQPYRFAGERFDLQTELYYLRARWLDVSASRFVSVDPAAGNIENPLSLNKYLYAEANPIANRDPTGLQATLAEGLGVAKAAANLRVTGLLFSLYTLQQICRVQALASKALSRMSPLARTVFLDPCDDDDLNVMRVQLQDETTIQGSDHTHGIPIGAPADTGVTAVQARAGLEALFFSTTPETVPWFPQKEAPAFWIAIKEQSIRIGNIVAGGGYAGQYSWSEDFGTNDFYRVDLENIRGHNLRE